jgi:uncharacterized protein
LKFQPDRLEGVNSVSRYEPGRVWVQGEVREASLLIPWRGALRPWNVARFEALSAAQFEQLLAFEPELVVFGSGERLRFVAPALTRVLIERRIGVETMDNAAACRTYNVLAGEGRSVVAALLIEAPRAL